MGVIEAASQTGRDWTRARIAETDAIRVQAEWISFIDAHC